MNYGNPQCKQQQRQTNKQTTKKWNIRVTKRDHTFATITCSLDTTVAELRLLLNKKFFIKKDDSYQFYMRKGGMGNQFNNGK